MVAVNSPTTGAALHPDVEPLALRSLDSIRLAIEMFNRPYDGGRPEAVLMLLHHGFELFLKSVIVARTGTAHDADRGFSYGFDLCLHIAADNLAVITKDERRFLSMLDNLRDCAVHYYQLMSEDLLYIFAQASITLYDKLLQSVTGHALKERLPARVLPLSSRPPKDLHLLVDTEFKNLRQTLRDLKITKEQAVAALRPLMAFALGASEAPRRMNVADLEAAVARLAADDDWRLTFPEIAKLQVSSEGDGIRLGVRVVKEDPGAMPVRVLKPGEIPPAEGVIIKQEINIFDKFNMGLYQLAANLGISGPKTLALLRKHGIQDDAEAYRQVRIGSVVYKRYSKRALDLLREQVKNADQAWQEQRQLLYLRKKKPR